MATLLWQLLGIKETKGLSRPQRLAFKTGCWKTIASVLLSQMLQPKIPAEQNQMNQTENDKPHSGHEEKKQLFLSNWKVPELLSCLANVKNGEPTHQLLLKGTHASLFHTEKPKPLSKISPISELQKIEETQHIKFLNLKDLQWKLYKGIVKRKQKVTASQREANYRPFRIFEEKTTKAEYIIPLISKN
ncbi:iron-sulfur cluster assembly 1-like protein, mitochondrial isoform B [Alligator mississippiensis]|uniref:Iron-sulfur cluster assembly 1-like protein, mitochondrial isoform B n=1 Tax=Alligator mississippiensis TaxID=8496 RepID=A0A151M867_ALLMI|nr:iron-sulfur cluster assembly 1-like protein, mitochondrial isoform B [Alligator mississippiensis]